MRDAGYLLRPYDVEFNRVPIRCHGSAGTPCVRWVASGMPKLGKYADILKAVFFLYENKNDAIHGEHSGGTGFLIAVPSEKWGLPYHHIHGVTNYHVAVTNSKGSSAPVVRINRKSGAPEIFDLDPGQWIFRPRWHDIAVSPPLPIRNTDIHDAIPMLGETWWLKGDEEEKAEIGPADDVFMIGRFIDYDGVETNSPAVRFGHISIADAKIEQPTGFRGRSIVVDLHSRSGFSGSPVMVYRTLGSHFIDAPEGGQGILTVGGGHYIMLLGMLWGAFPERWELEDEKARSEAQHNASLITEGRYVKGLSGMSCIIPSTYIRDLVMNDPKLKAMRASEDEQLGRQLGARMRPVPQSVSANPEAVAPETSSDANPDHLEDFNRLVSAASKSKPKGGRT